MRGSKIDETKPIVVTATLKDWQITESNDKKKIAVGYVYGDMEHRFGDGSYIYTSPIVDGPTPLGYIKTENSVYYLDPKSKKEEPNE